MEHTAIILILASIGAFFMAFNNGANDVANAFASAVGSKAITVRQALFIAAVLNLVGAVLLGAHVAETLIESVISPDVTIMPEEYVLGMIATLIASGLFVLFSTLTGMPVSSTHAIVGSLAGMGIIVSGFSAVNWGIFAKIGLTWLATPFIAGTIALLSVRLIRTTIYCKKRKAFKILTRVKNKVPIFTAITVGVLIFSLRYGPFAERLNLGLVETILILFFGVVFGYFSVRWLIKRWIKRTQHSEEGAESIFKKLQVGTSCYVAFAHGSNDVSNSISPVLAIFVVLQTGVIPTAANAPVIPIWILVLGGLGMALGIGLLGHKVMGTLGNKITLMSNSGGFSVDFATATTVVVASIVGMPVSSTHAATGSVIGVGLEKGRGGVNFSILIKIFAAWIITVPTAAALTALVYSLLKWILL